MSRRVYSLTILIAASSIAALQVGSHPVAAAPCWTPPVAGTVIDSFREPPCPYCAGNRGLEYRIGRGTPVTAVAAGTVTFAGSVAGVRYVVIRHVDGRRATYGKLTSTPLATGDRVLAGTGIGVASTSFYFGLRQGDTYIDPAPYLGRLVGRPRLIPIDGTRPRPAPAPRVSCAAEHRAAPHQRR